MHRRLGDTLRALFEKHPRDWDRRVPFAVWSWRETPQKSLGGLSPHRVVFGMQPRTPFSALMPVGRRRVGLHRLVAEMSKVFEETASFVRQFALHQKDRREPVANRSGKNVSFEIGDFVLVLRPEFLKNVGWKQNVSKTFVFRAFEKAYQIVQRISETNYVLRDPMDGSEPEEFENPIHVERPIPTSVWTLREPFGEPLKVTELLEPDEQTWAKYKLKEIGYGAALLVY